MLTTRWKRVLWMVVALPVSVYLCFEISLFGVSKLDLAWRPAQWGDSTTYAEVVAVLPGANPNGLLADIIPLPMVKVFVRDHPDCTFLIPRGREQEISEQLQHRVGWLKLEVKELSEGRQRITLEGMDRADDTYGTQYEATRTEVSLKYIRYVGDREIMGAVLNAALLTALIHIVAFSYVVIKKPRRSGSHC